jgi:geranylgeranylglycerol-phosphate geranylgeranyltransferase
MTALAKSRSVIALIRPEITLAIGACVLVGEITTLRNLPPIREALLGFLTGFFISSSAVVVNDYFDVEVDKVNAPDRPLQMGTISINEAILLAIATSVAGLVAAGLLGSLNFAIAAVPWMLVLLYSWKFKEMGLLGNMFVSISVAIQFVYGGAVVGDPLNGVVLSCSVIAFLADLGVEVASDVKDVRGDELRDVATVVRVWGRDVAVCLSSLLLLSVIPVGLVPYLMGWLGQIYVVVIALPDLILAYSVLGLFRSRTPAEVGRILRQLLLCIPLAFIAFVTGVLYH